VADITFAYENGHLVKLLMARGAALKESNFKKLGEVNLQVEDFVRKGSEDGTLVLPKKAFITFETENAYNFMQDKKINL
jgi:hypothetical protein